MKRFREKTLYRQLAARFLLFLVLPLFLVLILLAVKIFSEGKENYEERMMLITDKAMGSRLQHLSAVKRIEMRITGNESLKGFFLANYAPENLCYYAFVIIHALKPGPEESIYSVRVYFPNETIPRGFRMCYYLSDFSQKAASSFLASNEEDYWVMPEEAGEYSSLYTPYVRSYTHMIKVWAGDKLAYVLTVSVPEENMDAFLYDDRALGAMSGNAVESGLIRGGGSGFGGEDAGGDGAGGGGGVETGVGLGAGSEPESGAKAGSGSGIGDGKGNRIVTISREAITLDYSERSRSVRTKEFSIPGFPQKLVFLFGPDVQSRYVAVITAAVMLLAAAMVIFALRF